MVRAKFRCMEAGKKLVNTALDGTQTFQWQVRLLPVVHNKKGDYDVPSENKRFWEATPVGELTMGLLNEAAAAQFEVGQAYTLDFTPADG